MAWPGTAVELYHSRSRQGTDKTRFAGKRIWEMPSGQEDAAETYLWTNRFWTVNAHVMKLDGVAVDPRSRVGKALVTGTYSTSYNPATHPVGRATLSLDSNTTASKELRDVAGNDIWSTPDDDGYFYRPVKGDPLTFHHLSIVTVRTAYQYNGINWNLILNAFDKYNATELPNLGGMPVGRALLIGARIPKYFLLDNEASKVPVEYDFAYSQSGWDGVLVVQRHRRIVTLEPTIKELNADGSVYSYADENGEEILAAYPELISDAKMRSVIRNKKVDGEVTRHQYLPDAETFSHLMGLLSWMN